MKLRKEIIEFLIKIFGVGHIFTGVPAIIKNSKGEILLGKREKDAIYYPNTWGLPGGLIDAGESIEQAVEREVKEEMGVKIRVISYGKPFMVFPNKECPLQSLNVPVYAKIISGKPKPKDETSEVSWFAPKEIKKMKLAYSNKKLLEQEGVI